MYYIYLLFLDAYNFTYIRTLSIIDYRRELSARFDAIVPYSVGTGKLAFQL
jgi:hypothetical protein